MNVLIEQRCWKCDVVYGLSETFYQRRKEDGEAFFCPNGHTAVFKETELKKLRREAERLKQAEAMHEDEKRELRGQIQTLERSRRTLKGIVKKTKARVGEGKCPCCSESFPDVAKHMAKSHPNYATDKVVPLRAKLQS